jgi:hypothetical protein
MKVYLIGLFSLLSLESYSQARDSCFFSYKLNKTYGNTVKIDSAYYETGELRTVKFLTEKKCNICRSWKYIEFYKVGRKKHEIVTDSDSLTWSYFWHENGQLRSFGVSSPDEDFYGIEYYPSGKISQVDEQHKGCPFYFMKFYENGQKFCETYYDSLQKKFIRYHENGNIQLEATIFFYRKKEKGCKYIDEIFVGGYHEYYDTGILKISGQYKTYAGDEIFKKHMENGLKVGIWKYYTKAGKIESIENYDSEGNLIRKQ